MLDVTHKVEYKVRDLGTRSVTLFPTQAQIKREIKDVPLKPGTNEISVIGLSPTIDKNSVTVEGSGAATITGISVEFLPNREIFDEIYPESDAEESNSEDDSDDDDSEEAPEQPGLSEVKMRLVELRDDLQRAKEVISSADERIKILGAYSNSLKKREGIIISDVLDTYKQEREKAHHDRMTGIVRERAINRDINKSTAEHSRLSKLDRKLKAKAAKAKSKVQKLKTKQKDKLATRQAEQSKEKARIREERARCWPKFCYTVQIQLEVSPSFTPGSSRRASFSSDIDVAKPSPTRTMDVDMEDKPSCDLVLSYVTNSAFWTPSYDLQLSTVSTTGTLCFDAGLHNTTSETWENCKITLSTSQATSSSLDESIPILTPWRIKLAAKGATSDIFDSREERLQQGTWRSKRAVGPVAMPRRDMFGLENRPDDYQTQLMLLEQQNKKRLMMARQEQDSMPPPQGRMPVQMQQMQQMQMQQQQQQQAQQQAQARAQHLPQAPQMMVYAPPPPQQPQMQQMQQQPAFPGTWQSLDFSMGDDGLAGDDSDLLMPDAQPSLEFQDSLVEETGFTTTYDLPGLKTLVPKFTVSKQRVARITFSHVFFSHTVVAKYQNAAYLKAKLRNNSKLTLLKGPASLTLDGSFMGQTKIPRCSSGDTFTLSLGVDSAIKVLYPKPDVRRSTTGMFSKEDSSVYVRTVTVQNTRASAGKPVNVLVLDQIPVSEDDRLRVELLNPRGLALDGPRQPAGAPGRETQEDKDWGKATSCLKKGGQVNWEVSLNPGKAVKLGLEYSVSMPSGDVAREC